MKLKFRLTRRGVSLAGTVIVLGVATASALALLQGIGKNRAGSKFSMQDLRALELDRRMRFILSDETLCANLIGKAVAANPQSIVYPFVLGDSGATANPSLTASPEATPVGGVRTAPSGSSSWVIRGLATDVNTAASILTTGVQLALYDPVPGVTRTRATPGWLVLQEGMRSFEFLVKQFRMSQGLSVTGAVAQGEITFNGTGTGRTKDVSYSYKIFVEKSSLTNDLFCYGAESPRAVCIAAGGTYQISNGIWSCDRAQSICQSASSGGAAGDICQASKTVYTDPVGAPLKGAINLSPGQVYQLKTVPRGTTCPPNNYVAGFNAHWEPICKPIQVRGWDSRNKVGLGCEKAVAGGDCFYDADFWSKWYGAPLDEPTCCNSSNRKLLCTGASDAMAWSDVGGC